MYQSIKDQIGKYLAFFEGAINWMYLDERGLVTTGKGNLLDPYASYGRSVRFVHKDGSAASDAEVKAEFDMVKKKTIPGGGAPDKDYVNAFKFQGITNLRATDADIYAAVTRALVAKEGEARSYFEGYDSFPADVQVVLMQMGYAGGLASRRNELTPLLKKRDFWMARQYTYLTNVKRGRDGYKKYNAAFPMLMATGWIVDQCKDKKMLHWAPKDPSIFYGYERFLQVKRWYMGQDVSRDVRLNDEILMGNGEQWLNDKAK